MQEIEKILEELDDAIEDYAGGSEANGLQGFVKGLKRAKKIIRKHMNDGWIPVEDRTPEPYQQVLVSMYNNLTYVTIGHYNGKGWNVHEYITDLGVDVKAWRPLPQPYHPRRRERDNETN